MEEIQLVNSDILSIVRGTEFRSLGFKSNASFIGALNSDLTFTTYDILKIHISRILLLIIYMFYKNIKDSYKHLVGSWETARIIYIALSLNIFQFEKFLQLVVKLFQFSLANIDQNSLNIVFDFYPEPKKLPRSISLILTMRPFEVCKPKAIPTPYLDNEKKLVVPSEKEVSDTIALRNEYFTRQRLFVVAEKFRLLSDMSKFILWSAFTTIEYINIYEPFGTLWKQNTTKSFEIIKEFIVNEFDCKLKCCSNENTLRKSLPTISLIDLNSDYHLDVKIEPLKTEIDEKISPVQDDWVDEDTRVFKVYLVDARLNELIKLPKSSDLIIIPETNTIKFRGYKTSITSKSTIVYNLPDKFNLKTFIKGMNYYGKRQKVGVTETRIANPN